MKKKLAILFVVSSLSIYVFLSLNNFNIGNSWAEEDVEIIATINGQEITKSEFDKFESVIYVRRPDKKERQNFFNKVINASLIASKAKAIGLDSDPIIQQKIKATKKNLLFWSMRDKIKEQIDLGPFSKYLEQKFRFREIVVQSLSEAEQIRKDILNGQDFEVLARERSINKYSKNGGDTGFIALNSKEFPKEVVMAIFKLEDEQISEIIKTWEGYAIFKAIERKDLTEQEKVLEKEALLNRLVKEKGQELLEKFRSHAKIKRFSNNISKILDTKELRKATQIELINIDGTIIRLRDLLNSFIKHNYFDIQRFGQYLTEPFIKTMIENGIIQALMVKHAGRIGLDKTPEIKKTIKRYEEWQLASKYIRDVLLKDITCTEEEIKRFYEDNKDNPRYENIKECIRVRRIMVEQKSTAEEILRQLKNGVDFFKLAQNYSLLNNNRIGGNLGYLERGCSKPMKITSKKKYEEIDTMPLDEEEEKVAFGLSKGEASDIIKVSVDEFKLVFYSIIKVEDKIEKGINGYNEIKGFLENELIKEKEKEKYSDFIAQLKSNATIKVVNNF